MSNNYAIIEDQLIINSVIAEDAYAQSQGWILLPEEFAIGDSYINGQFIKKKQTGLTREEIKLNNETIAKDLLIDTDWAAIPTIADPQYSNPYLTNQADFLTYRNQVRAIVINPPDTLVTEWPTRPDAIWSK